MVVKGRNRDTAWFAMLDCDWPMLKAGYEAWLHPANFDAAGTQRDPLTFAGPRASTETPQAQQWGGALRRRAAYGRLARTMQIFHDQ